MTPLKFQKKPIVVDVVQYLYCQENEVADWIRENGGQASYVHSDHVEIETPSGPVRALPGDFIVKGTVQGDFYPVKPGIFDDIYEPASYST